MIAVLRTFLGAGPPIVYKESYPAQFSFDVNDISNTEQQTILPFLTRAKAGGVGGHIHFAPNNFLLGDDTTTPIADPEVCDDTTTPIAGAGICSYTVELGP
jgi:hypothetical protein